MLPYWLLFFLAAWRASTRLHSVQAPTIRWPDWWWVTFAALVLMIGLRHQVGGEHQYTDQHPQRDDNRDNLERLRGLRGVRHRGMG